MKTILMLTDFSENAAHAALSGVMFGKKIHANLLLFNANVAQPVAPAYAGGITVIDNISYIDEENKRQLEQLADSLKPFLSQEETEWMPSLHFEEGLGGLALQVKNLIREKEIEMVVMGARTGSSIDHLLTGSDTYSVIDGSKRPVLIVPAEADFAHLRKVVFATNFIEADIKAIHYLIKLGHIFNYHLEVVHINLLGEDDITKDLRKAEFMKHVRRLRYTNIEIKELYGKDVTGRLNKYCEESGTDLLSFTHYKNSLFSIIFRQSITKKAISKQKVPLLVFPSKNEQD